MSLSTLLPCETPTDDHLCLSHRSRHYHSQKHGGIVAPAHGLPARVIIDELGDAGRGLNAQNITNWVQGGYQD